MRLKTKFQDEDFDLGEVVEANIYYGGNGRLKVVTEPAKGGIITFYFETLKGLNKMFEDADAPEEPKGSALDLMILTLTNFIENEPDEDKVDLEDCKQMLEKLRAWKRLKDKGFRFKGYTDDSGDLFSCQVIRCSFDDFGKESRKDLDLLFSQEDD